MKTQKRYLSNPDVSCRVERQGEGALLFNPDTDNTMVINPVGLLIWQVLDQPATRAEIVTHLLATCKGVPTDQVAVDVEEYLNTLLPGGYVGEVLENDDR